MEKIQISKNGPTISKFALGFWRLASWNKSKTQLDQFVRESIELGITTMDHADIYGSYTCEAIFGELIKDDPSLREEIEIVTKCGIKLVSENRPNHNFHCYDTSYRHIISSVEKSLLNLNTDYIDILLIHRPDPFMDPNEAAKAFTKLKESGKVLHFGVSNFSASQFTMLNSYLDNSLVTNQIEFSALHLDPLNDGVIDLMLQLKVSPMIWSPLAGGRIFTEQSERAERVRNTLNEISEETNADSINQIALAFITNHPAECNIVLGSGNFNRIADAVKSDQIKLSKEQWFRIWTASTGHEVP